MTERKWSGNQFEVSIYDTPCGLPVIRISQETQDNEDDVVLVNPHEAKVLSGFLLSASEEIQARDDGE